MMSEVGGCSLLWTPASDIMLDIKYYCVLRGFRKPLSRSVSEVSFSRDTLTDESCFERKSRASRVTVCKSDDPMPARVPRAVRCVAISDTHTRHASMELPDGDILLHCGDFSNLGTLEECKSFCEWMATLPFQHKLLVCGNHDMSCDREWYMNNWETWHDALQSPEIVATMMQNAGLTILADGEVEVCGIRIYGNPAQPRQPKNRLQMAFGRKRGAELKHEWAKLPSNIDVLMTHTPPFGILDSDPSGKMLGCEELAKAVRRVKPAVHVFGHVHDGYGVHTSTHTHFINAACARQRRAECGHLNRPIVFDVLSRGK